MYFEIVKASGGYRAHLRGGNHELIFWTEVYTYAPDPQSTGHGQGLADVEFGLVRKLSAPAGEASPR